MERELWSRLYPLLRASGAEVHQARVSYQPWQIAAVLAWAALHDRPIRWACDARNWPSDLRPARLPSASTMSRRLRSLAVGAVLRALEARLGAAVAPGLAAAIDGKPLPVSGVSKAPEAQAGRGAGMMAKGYKLYAVWAGRPVPESWEVRPMSVNEVAVAKDLIPRLAGGGYLLGDNQYDANELYELAAAAGYQLLAPRRRGAAGLGHCAHSGHRLRGMELLGRAFGRGVYAARGAIERSFGNASSFAGGLGPLPAWVRRRHRVERWVWAKLLINGVRIVEKHRLTA